MGDVTPETQVGWLEEETRCKLTLASTSCQALPWMPHGYVSAHTAIVDILIPFLCLWKLRLTSDTLPNLTKLTGDWLVPEPEYKFY